MDKKVRYILLGALAIIGIAVLIWAWRPQSPSVNPTIVNAAADSSREAQQSQPPAPEEPKREGRARPGSLGGH